MHIGQPVREVVAEPVVDPVPAAAETTSVRIHLTPAPLAPGPHGAVGGPDDPGAASPARV